MMSTFLYSKQLRSCLTWHMMQVPVLMILQHSCLLSSQLHLQAMERLPTHINTKVPVHFTWTLDSTQRAMTCTSTCLLLQHIHGSPLALEAR